MQVSVSDRPEPETSHIPECLMLWRCIGCGAMGNSELCTGACAYRKLEIVGADEYADLLETFEAIEQQAERLEAVVKKIAAVGIEQTDFEDAYRRLQVKAREILRSVDFGGSSWQNAVDPDYEPATVWLCTTCGQIEAPQPCLGVCIRRNGEFLRADHHVALVGRIGSEHRRARELGALVRQLAWVAPHAGQCEKACRAFQAKAITLLNSAHTSPSDISRTGT
jgi:hypothetical protein